MNRSGMPWRAFVISVYVVLATAAGTAQARALPDFTGLVEKYSPAVVNISTTQKQSSGSSSPHGFEIPDLPEDNPLYDFFRRFMPDEEGDERERAEMLLEELAGGADDWPDAKDAAEDAGRDPMALFTGDAERPARAATKVFSWVFGFLPGFELEIEEV